MTTVTYQNGRNFTLNPIYFANEFSDLFTLKPSSSFKKKSVDVFLQKKIFFEKLYLQNFFKYAYLLIKLKEMFKEKKNWGSPNSFAK